MKTILMIEDDKIISSIYRNKFQSAGFKVELADDGKTGLEMVSKTNPDIVILDLMLPGMNGVEIIKTLRARPETKNLPLLVFSNGYLSNVVQDAWKAGATSCVVKMGCTPNQLIGIIEKLLASASTPATPAPSARAPHPANPTKEADAVFQAELRRDFLKEAPTSLAQMRELLLAFNRTEGEAARLEKLLELYKKIRSLASNAAIVEANLAPFASALEALVKEIYDKPKNITTSSIRTIATALDLLFQLAESGEPFLDPSKARNVLVVDDEAISRRAVVHALERAHLKSFAVDHPEIALKVLKDNSFDLVILDVDMPGMDGFELCKRLHALPRYKDTPVVFVTSLSDFSSRAKSALSGGNDLIGKPFAFMELAVKALIYLQKAEAISKGKIASDKALKTAPAEYSYNDFGEIIDDPKV